MFNDHCTTTKYLVFIEETGSDYPFLFKTTSNYFVAKMIVDNYIAGISDCNTDAELLENEVLSHPDMVYSSRIKLNGLSDIIIGIYKVENVELKN